MLKEWTAQLQIADAGGGLTRSFYRVVMPGWGGDECNVGKERADGPYMIFEESGGCYRHVRTDQPPTTT